MALVRVLQGPPPGRYGKHTHAHTHRHACALYTSTRLSATSSIATFLFIWVCGPCHAWTSASSCHQQSLREKEREMPFKDGLPWPCGLISEEVYFSVWHSRPTHLVPAKKTETPWKAMSREWGMFPGKNIPEGGWNQNSGKRRKSTCSAKEKCTRHPLFTVVSVCICWRSLKPVDYVMLTEQGNEVYCAKQVTFSERGVGLPCRRGGSGV